MLLGIVVGFTVFVGTCFVYVVLFDEDPKGGPWL